MTEYFIALDVHCAFSELAAMTGTEKLVRRDHCPTTIPALAEALKAVRRPRRLTFEEGPLADWLTRELRSHVDELVVCEPQRNHWICPATATRTIRSMPASWPTCTAADISRPCINPVRYSVRC